MTNNYTLQQVIDLQNQKRQLEERLAIHKQRASEKEKEIQEIFQKVGVSNLQELNTLCAKTNQEMQEYAMKQSEIVKNMKEQCDELDRML